MYTIKVVKTTEADIIEKLDSVQNKAGYIKKLIRKDIAEEKKIVTSWNFGRLQLITYSL